MAQDKTIFMVKGAGPATVQHGSYDAAAHEAHRLAEKFPGQAFFVLKSVKRIVHAPEGET
ncbi:MAG: hypothetical protein AAGI34_13745 [Pseudomonadota bacterium]